MKKGLAKPNPLKRNYFVSQQKCSRF